MVSFKKLLEGKNRPLVMGILNLTPDSFSDGGECVSFDSALEKLKILQEQGADIIDIGACSTAPDNEIVSEGEELRRLAALPELMKYAEVPVSVDTFRPAVAEFALKCGVSIVNDESGAFSQTMADVVKAYGAGWIFMHTGGKGSREAGEYTDGVVSDVLSFFDDMKNKAKKFGIDEASVCFDCGIGFGKTRRDDIELLRNIEALSVYSPLLVGVSRKRVIGEMTGKVNPKDRVSGSVAAAAVAVIKGASVLRVHDVAQTLDAVNVSNVLKGSEL